MKRLKKLLFKRNDTVLLEKLKESLSAVLPVTVLLLLLVLTITPLGSGTVLTFLFGALMLIVGMGLFNLGADQAMQPMGEIIGASLTRSRKLFRMIFVAFLVGFLITVSEPDLQVLAGYMPDSVSPTLLIFAVAGGVGLFLVVAMLRILLRVPLRLLLLGMYVLTFILAALVPADFWTIAFDAGGVTTGPMTVPFILALGSGVASLRGADKDSEEDNFGLVALCSIGPIMAVLIIGLIFGASGAEASVPPVTDAPDSVTVSTLFLHELPDYAFEVLKALVPIVALFFAYNLLFVQLSLSRLYKICVGLLYTYVGLVLFLCGANVGFSSAGVALGEGLAGGGLAFLLVPVGMVIGYYIVKAEPAVHQLAKQVEQVTAGAVPAKAIFKALSFGVATSVGLAMLRVLTGINIMWFLIPGYFIALVLSFFVPDIFSSIAFDSGGVASGPMTAAFLLPLALGAAGAVWGTPVTAADGFGVVAMVAMTPLIAIQVLGAYYALQLKKNKKLAGETMETVSEEIIVTDTDTVVVTGEAVAANGHAPAPTVEEIIDL